jgi:hypothetical protein
MPGPCAFTANAFLLNFMKCKGLATMRTYAIGDIHGHLNLLKAAHARITEDRKRSGDHDAPIVHVGDLVDRGPNSADVIEYLLQGQAAGEPWIVLKGNHDRMLAGFLVNPSAHDPCLRAGLSYLHPRIGGWAHMGCKTPLIVQLQKFTQTPSPRFLCII